VYGIIGYLWIAKRGVDRTSAFMQRVEPNEEVLMFTCCSLGQTAGARRVTFYHCQATVAKLKVTSFNSSKTIRCRRTTFRKGEVTSLASALRSRNSVITHQVYQPSYVDILRTGGQLWLFCGCSLSGAPRRCRREKMCLATSTVGVCHEGSLSAAAKLVAVSIFIYRIYR